LDSLRGEVKQVLRRLKRAPMFTSVALLTLALGIGANTAIFSVVEGVLLKPLPYPKPEQLISLNLAASGLGLKELILSPSVYFTLREGNHTFQELGLYTSDAVSVTGVTEPEQVDAVDVTDGVIPLLGVSPVLGRSFTHKEDMAGSPETVVLSFSYWQRRFGGDPSILGRRLVIDGKAREVIGVMPKDFRFLDFNPAVFLPFQFDRAKTLLGNFSFNGVGRLKAGVSLAQADADAAHLLPIVNRTFRAPEGFSLKLFESAGVRPAFRPFKQELVGDAGRVLWVLMGTIGLVLLIACANVANLLLVRAEARRLELLVRSALGASRWRIARDLLAESVTLGMLGGVLGLALAYGALRALVAIAPAGIPRLNEIGIDGLVLLFALAVSLLTGALFGSVPVLKYAGVGLGVGLREGGRTLSESRERHRARNGLVVVQVTLALVLLISSGLMIRTFIALNHVQPGFSRPAEVQTVEISIPETQVPQPEKVLRMQRDMLERIEQIPGVRSAAFTTSLPMDNRNSADPLFARDKVYAEGKIPPIRRFVFISPGVHKTLGTPLIAGRDLTWTDVEKKAPVALISESFAREYWQAPRNALHKEIRDGSSGPWREIIGVAGDVYDEGVNKKASRTAYWPTLLQSFWEPGVIARRDVFFAVRSKRAGSESFVSEIRRAIWAVNPNVPVAQVRTLDQIYRRSMARTSFTLVMLAIAGGMALLLGMIGIYGVIAYSVSQRTREIGIRMALGAERRQMISMFVRDGVRLTTIGGLIGLVTAFLLMRLLSSLLFDVSPVDPLTYLVVSAGLLGAAALASYLPSRRAAAVDPAVALRLE
jgi:predicted permease